ncbi:MAG: hypothetical protein HRU34_17300 [Richelia sp.]|nr:hypothetical protein [Richelia sp.]
MTNRLQQTFYISAQCKVEDIYVVEDANANHIRKLHTEIVQESEIECTRTRVINKFIFGNEKPSSRAKLYAYYQ